jgi:hypothetical protein
VLVLIGPLLGHPLDLSFDVYELVAVITAVMISNLVKQPGDPRRPLRLARRGVAAGRLPDRGDMVLFPGRLSCKAFNCSKSRHRDRLGSPCFNADRYATAPDGSWWDRV